MSSTTPPLSRAEIELELARLDVALRRQHVGQSPVTAAWLQAQCARLIERAPQDSHALIVRRVDELLAPRVALDAARSLPIPHGGAPV